MVSFDDSQNNILVKVERMKLTMTQGFDDSQNNTVVKGIEGQ